MSPIRSWKSRNGLRRLKLELRGPRNHLKIGPQTSGEVRSAPLLAQMPNLPTKRAGGRAGGASRGGPGRGGAPREVS
eukprot:12379416-Alexandrium_andersonii.AAC.1